MHEKSIELLKKAVGDELQAVHQYMYFHFHCDDQGLDPISNLFKRTAIEEMMHIEKLSERILFLKGDVELNANGPVQQIKDVKSMLEMACKMEEGSISQYNHWANECSQNADSVSKKLFEELVMDEERHFSQFNDELENIARFGPNYLALQSMERSRGGMGMPPAGGNPAAKPKI
jgi:bacterioferritin